MKVRRDLKHGPGSRCREFSRIIRIFRTTLVIKMRVMLSGFKSRILIFLNSSIFNFFSPSRFCRSIFEYLPNYIHYVSDTFRSIIFFYIQGKMLLRSCVYIIIQNHKYVYLQQISVLIISIK